MTEWVESTVRARYLVAALGESASPPWWRSEATTPAGRRMLERIFPRTALAASLKVACDAARAVHDDRIGRRESYHLFRLPIADEDAILDYLKTPAAEELLRELALTEDNDGRLAALRKLAGDQQAQGQGPVRCGSMSAIRSESTLLRFCAFYGNAFAAGVSVFPYVDGAVS